MSRTVGALKTTISLDSAQFQQSMQGVNRQLRGLKSETRAVTSSGTGFARGVTEMRAKADVLNRTLEVQQAKVNELRKRYEQSRKETGENSKETQNANTAYQRAVSDMNKTENALKGLTAEIERQTNPWKQLSTEMQNAGESMQRYGRNMTSFGRSMSMRVTAPLLAVGGGALKVGMDFEEGMSKVQAISGATGDDLESLRDEARDLGATTRFSATEAASGMEFLAMAGFETTEVLETMPGLLDLAASSGMDLGRSADIATNILSGFNYEAEESGRVADVLAKGSSTANTNVEQLGSAMEVVAPIAEMVDLEIEGLTAAIGKMSDSGIQGQKAGRQLRQGILRLSDPTGKAADLIEELGINVFDSEGNMKDLDQVVGELNKGLEGMDSQAEAAALSTLFGSESTAGWSALLSEGEDSLADYTKELEESEGAASDMAETMEDNAKGALREMKSAAEDAAIELAEHMLPAVTDLIEEGTGLIRKFGDLDDSTQENIIKMGLFAAAIGPTAIVAGNLTTAIGGVVSGGGKLVGLLGGSTGLIARFATMGAAGGPVLLAAAGVGILSYKLIDAYRDSKKLHDVSTDLADEMIDQQLANEGLIDSFDKLRRKSKLTNDEFVEYLDLQSRMKTETDPEVIEKIQQKMDRLQRDSGLSNKELETMVGLNGDIVEALPESTTEITEQGNRVADTTENLRDYNREIMNMASRELDSQLQKSLSNDKKLREQIKDAQEEHNRLVEYEKELRGVVNELSNKSLEQVQEELEAQAEKIQFALINGGIEEENIDAKNDELETLNKILDNLELGEGHLRGHLSNTMETVDEQKDLVDEKEKELGKTGEIIEKMAEHRLISMGLTDDKAKQLVQDGETMEYLDKKLEKLQEEKDEIDKRFTGEERLSQEYRDQVESINKQISEVKDVRGGIQGLIGEVKDFNYELGRQIEKELNLSTSPSVSSLNSILSAPVNKNVNVRGGAYATYASGTDNHPGGPFIAGEEGWELGRMGNQWEMLNAGFYERPKGYEVFTHAQSKRIMRSLNNMPKYAAGTNMQAETNRLTNQPIESNQPIVLEINVTSELDGKTVGRNVERYVTEIQDRDQRVRETFA